MQCRDAKAWLGARRDGDLAQSEAQILEEHLQQCSICRAFEKRIQNLDNMFRTPAPRVQTSISTDRIMLAIQQQKRITDQLEDIRKQQRSRVEGMRSIGGVCIALGFFTLSSIPLLVLAMMLIQTDLVVKTLYILNDVIDVFIVLAQYIQIGLTMVTRDNWLLSGVSFVVVVM